MSLSERLSSWAAGHPPAYRHAWSIVLVHRSGLWAYPFLMLFLTSVRGFSVQAAGLAMSCMGAGSVCAAALGGQLADRWGRRPTIVTSLFGGALTMALLPFAQTRATTYAIAFGVGLLGDLYRPAVSAIVSDVVAPEKQSNAFAGLYWAHNFGFAVAPAAAGLAVSRFGFAPLFWVNAGAWLACGLAALIVLRETRPAARDAASTETDTSVHALRDPRLRLLLAAFTPMTLLMVQTISALPMLMRAGGLDAASYGRILSVNGVLIVLLQPWLVARLSLSSRTPVVTIGALCLAFGYAGHAFAKTELEHVLTLVVWTLGEISIVPLMAAWVAELAPASQRGRYQGAYALTWSFAQLASPWIATHLLASIGTSGWGLVCAGAGVLSAVLYAAASAQRKTA